MNKVICAGVLILLVILVCLSDCSDGCIEAKVYHAGGVIWNHTNNPLYDDSGEVEAHVNWDERKLYTADGEVLFYDWDIKTGILVELRGR